MEHEPRPALNSPDLRLVRFLLPAYLVREIDELVLAGQSGYETREEFIRDAIQNHVLEVKHGPAEGNQLLLLADQVASSASARSTHSGSRSTSGDERASNAEASAAPVVSEAPEALADTSALVPFKNLSETRLSRPRRGATLASGISRVREESMLGLHNRDYPSIWAARLLADMTLDRPVILQEFFDGATREAWRYGQRLLPLEKAMKLKLTALFPTNIAKAQASEQGFRTFAIGEIARRPNDDGTVNATGPLFLWRTCELTREDGRLLTGLTPQGYDLLDTLDGLTLDWPHEREHAERFITFIRSHAPSDWSGFAVLLEAAVERPNREELTERFQSSHPEWGAAKANTNAAGYVARAREWGLIEPKLVDGRYTLTEFGDEVRAKEA